MKNLGIWRNFSRSWRHHTTLQITTLAVLTGTFVVITLSLLIHHNLDKILSRWGNSMQMSVYLNDDLTDDQRSTVEKFLKEKVENRGVTYFSKEDAARLFKEKLKDLVPDLLEDKEFGNPLPASFEVKFNSRFSRDSEMNKLLEEVKQIESLAGVEDVLYGQGWVENYVFLVSSFKWGSLAAIFLLVIGTFLVIGNSIKSSIAQRQDEIEVLELFGATSTMIQVPFILEGALLGLFASAGSLVVCYFFYLGQESVLSGSLEFWGLSQVLSFLSIGKILSILFLGVFAGALGSYFCVYRLNNGWAAAVGMNDEG
ncbi:MAG: ABC transporter permease [Bdellovibrionales bacterium]|nr:ABC transporter permease [Bdellovibrionales bacterium]